MTQCDMILEMAGSSWVTPMDALRDAGCMRLGARIHDLKEDGHEFDEKSFSHSGRFGKKTYKGFKLKKKVAQGELFN